MSRPGYLNENDTVETLAVKSPNGTTYVRTARLKFIIRSTRNNFRSIIERDCRLAERAVYALGVVYFPFEFLASIVVIVILPITNALSFRANAFER